MEAYVTQVNTAFADPNVDVVGIVQGAADPLAAVRSAGLEPGPVEEEFMRGIPADIWTRMQAAIVAARSAGNRLTLRIVAADEYSLDPTRPIGDTDLVLRGPIPDAGDVRG